MGIGPSILCKACALIKGLKVHYQIDMNDTDVCIGNFGQTFQLFYHNGPAVHSYLTGLQGTSVMQRLFSHHCQAPASPQIKDKQSQHYVLNKQQQKLSITAVNTFFAKF